MPRASRGSTGSILTPWKRGRCCWPGFDSHAHRYASQCGPRSGPAKTPSHVQRQQRKWTQPLRRRQVRQKRIRRKLAHPGGIPGDICGFDPHRLYCQTKPGLKSESSVTPSSPRGSETAQHSWLIVGVGIVALAVAMGVGRFAFTPMMLLMLRDGTITAISGPNGRRPTMRVIWPGP